MSNYLSIDQALQVSGFAVFNEKQELIKNGVFKTKNEDDIEKRLATIIKNLDMLFNEYSFVHIYFEDCQQQQNAQTYHKLSMVKATILLWCYFNNIPYTILAPSHWRSLIKEKYNISFGRSRKEQKKACQDFIDNIFNLKVSEDEADAIAIGVAGFIEENKNKSAF